MSYSVGIKNSDIDWQIDVLRHYKELSDKHYRPVMVMNTARAHSTVASRIPRGETGEALKSFGSKVSGVGYNVKGRIGWLDSDDPYYPNVLEYGSRSHAIGSGSKSRTRSQRERFLNKKESGTLGAGSHIRVGGQWKTVAMVKGMAARGFMSSTFDQVAPNVETDLYQATEAILAELSQR